MKWNPRVVRNFMCDKGRVAEKLTISGRAIDGKLHLEIKPIDIEIVTER